MIKIVAILAVIFLSGCEVFTIGTKHKKKEVVDYNQETPLGAVYLFKTELDSNNIPAATQILANPQGVKYLAIEQYEMYDEIARINRLIALKPITSYKLDTLEDNSYKIDVEFDYLQNMGFRTRKIDDYWYIVAYIE